MFETLPAIAFIVSLASLALSFVSYRQSKKTESLALRREAINHVRTAFHDVVLDGHITTKTADSIREAVQLAELVFSSNVKSPLTQAHAAASRLQNTPSERQTNRYHNEKATLGKHLDTVLERMNKEPDIVGWPAWLSDLTHIPRKPGTHLPTLGRNSHG
jgi:hypothetical protein